MNEIESEEIHSKWNILSYGCGSLSREFISIAFNVIVFFYYEVEIGLNVWLIAASLTIFVIYNALNDPIIGYLTNRPFKFTKRLGRRKLWILLGGIPLGFCYFLIFTPPSIDPIADGWLIFTWLVFTTCLFDTAHSLFWVNFQSLFPDKFRSAKERRTVTGVQIVLGIFGVAFGSIIPPLIYHYGDLESYIIQGIVVIIYGLVTMLFAIPGLREDQEMVDRYLRTFDEKEQRTSFIKTMRTAFKQKSFVGSVFFYTMYNAAVSSMTSSIPYLVFNILGMLSSATTLIMAGLLVGQLISIPLWVKLSHKLNDNRKIMIIGAIIMAVFMIPLIFLESYVIIIVVTVFWAIGQGAYWLMIFPVFSEVIDESVVRTKKREEGTYIGIQQFFGRLGLIIQIMSFAIVHELTGFIEGVDTQSSLVIWGIHIHLALIPLICIIIGTLVFWKLFDLTPERIAENQLVIKELQL